MQDESEQENQEHSSAFVYQLFVTLFIFFIFFRLLFRGMMWKELQKHARPQTQNRQGGGKTERFAI
jgi:hypothetical protein